LRNISYLPSLVRYPPVSKFLYFFAYSAFGINHIVPRIIQLFFYLFCAVYLYRTINLFHAKETALLGALIYLFLPISFFYSRLGELESGVISLIALNSFYFLRYIKDRDSRDLILSTYITGFGFLYKDPVFLVFPVCLAILIYYTIKNRLPSLLPLKILLLAPITVIPWMIIAKFFSWRNYTFQMSNLTSLDTKIIPYFLMISSNLSEIIFILFVLSVFYVCMFQRNVLTGFFSLLFSVYFFFIISDMGSLSPRFSMVLYPTVTVFLSLFISRMIIFIPWRHAFKICFLCLAIYLIIITTASPLSNRFLSIENMKIKYFPSDKAMRWVKDNVKEGEQILIIRIQSAGFYQKKYAIEKEKIIDYRYDLGKINTPEKYYSLYGKHGLSYIMFPYSQEYIKQDINAGILEYLKNNPNNEFLEVARFNLDKNYIYIYKLKKA
jgi:4-amino-4-deoxy-L-arabinose transferase-like glycosyltransferase